MNLHLLQHTDSGMEVRTNFPIDLSNISKAYHTASGPFTALRDITLRVRRGQMVALTGKSGSGKSTLLNIISGIDRPSSGRVSISGISTLGLTEGELAAWRGNNIGIVFQFFQLLPTLTVLENVMLPMDFCGTYAEKDRLAKALGLFERVGIQEQAHKFPTALSGGQQQRAAIARALANDPPIIVADEPTGNLDSRTATSIFDLFLELASPGKTVVVATHEREFSKYFERTISLSDGTIVEADGGDRIPCISRGGVRLLRGKWSFMVVPMEARPNERTGGKDQCQPSRDSERFIETLQVICQRA